MSDATAWEHAGSVYRLLNARNGTGGHEIAMRLLKITEEAGEAAQAYIGFQGQNPRKGVTHSRTDVAAELCDVILSAMVALHSFSGDPEEFFAGIVAQRAARLEASYAKD